MFQKEFLSKFFTLKNLTFLAFLAHASNTPAQAKEAEEEHAPSISIPQKVFDRSIDDLHDLLSKMQIKGPIQIINETGKKVSLTILTKISKPSVYNTHHDHSLSNLIFHPLQEVSHLAGEAIEEVTEILSALTYHDSHKEVKFDKKQTKTLEFFYNLDRFEPNDHFYINVSSTTPFELTLNSSQRLIFPRKLGGFNFVPHAFYPLLESSKHHEWVKEARFGSFKSEPAFILEGVPHFKSAQGLYHPHYNPDPPCHEEEFKKQFDCHLVFLTQVQCVQEAILPASLLFEQRHSLYEENKFNPLLSLSLESSSSYFSLFGHPHAKPRIPLTTHRIWLTNPKAPQELPNRYFNWASESMVTMPASQGWTHNLWIQDKALLPETVVEAKKRGINIKVISKNLLKKPQGIKIFEDSLSKNKFGQASDILRCMILNQEGGIYPDTDYLITQSPLFFNYLYDFYAGIEPMSAFVANSYIASKPGHPIIKKALALMERNFTELAPEYIQTIDETSGFKTIQLTGPGMFTTAVFKGAGQRGNRDIIFPPEVLYPIEGQQIYPAPAALVVKPGQPMPAQSGGAHFWEGSWIPGDTKASLS